MYELVLSGAGQIKAALWWNASMGVMISELLTMENTENGQDYKHCII